MRYPQTTDARHPSICTEIPTKDIEENALFPRGWAVTLRLRYAQPNFTMKTLHRRPSTKYILRKKVSGFLLLSHDVLMTPYACASLSSSGIVVRPHPQILPQRL